MNDTYVKFEFEIQILLRCHASNGDSVYTVSVYKIYSILFRKQLTLSFEIFPFQVGSLFYVKD